MKHPSISIKELAPSKCRYSLKRVQDALQGFFILFFLYSQPLCSSNRRMASDLQRLNTQQQSSTNDTRYFPPEAAGSGRSLEEGDYWTSIHQPDTYTVQNQCSQSSASAGGVNMSQFLSRPQVNVHRAHIRSRRGGENYILASRWAKFSLSSNPSIKCQKQVLTFQSVKYSIYWTSNIIFALFLISGKMKCFAASFQFDLKLAEPVSAVP